MYQRKGTLPSVAAHGERRAVATTTALDYIPKPLRTAMAIAAVALLGLAADGAFIELMKLVRNIGWSIFGCPL